MQLVKVECTNPKNISIINTGFFLSFCDFILREKTNVKVPIIENNQYVKHKDTGVFFFLETR